MKELKSILLDDFTSGDIIPLAKQLAFIFGSLLIISLIELL